MTTISGLTSNSRTVTPAPAKPATQSLNISNFTKTTASTPSAVLAAYSQAVNPQSVNYQPANVTHMSSTPANKVKVENLNLTITNKLKSDEIISELEKQNKVINGEITRLDKEIPTWKSELEQAQRKWRDSAQGDGHLMETKILEGKMKVLDKQYRDKLNDKSMLEYCYKQNNLSIGLAPYEDIRDTASYKSYLNKKSNNVPNDIGKYMSDDQRNMYSYLLATNNPKSEKYLDLLQDSINKAKGTEKAQEFISKLQINSAEDLTVALKDIYSMATDKNSSSDGENSFFGLAGKIKDALKGTANTTVRVGAKGFTDGIQTFNEGIYNAIVYDDKVSASAYERMVIMQYLSEQSKFYGTEYEFASTLGNMVPSIAASAIASAVATPAVGEVVGQVLMGVSAGGNAKHEALVEGNGPIRSTIYGLATGLSEAGLEKVLGGITGVSDEAGFTIKSIFSEGREEFIQDWVGAGCDAVILNKSTDLDELTLSSIKSFAMGAAMAGTLNGVQAGISVTVNGVSEVWSTSKLLEYAKSKSKTVANISTKIDNISQNVQAKKQRIGDILNTPVDAKTFGTTTAALIAELNGKNKISSNNNTSPANTAAMMAQQNAMKKNGKISQAMQAVRTGEPVTIAASSIKEAKVLLDEVKGSNLVTVSINGKVYNYNGLVQHAVDSYVANAETYARRGVSMKSYLKDLNIDTVSVNSKMSTAKTLGDSKLLMLAKMEEILQANKLPKAKLEEVYQVYSKHKSKTVGDLDVSEMLNDVAPYLSEQEVSEIITYANSGKVDTYVSGLSYAEKAAVYNYTACGGFEINAWLCDGEVNDGKGGRVKIRERFGSIPALQNALSGHKSSNTTNRVLNSSQGNIVECLDSVISKAKYDEAIVTYRGVKKLRDHNVVINPDSLKVGDTFGSSGYQSSSITLDQCFAVRKNNTDTNIILEIVVPPQSGTAAYIENMTGVKNYSQMEVLIKRDAKMTVVGDVYKKVINGVEKTFVPVVVQ